MTDDGVPPYKLIVPRKRGVKDGEWRITVELWDGEQNHLIGQQSVTIADSYIHKNQANLGYLVTKVSEEIVKVSR